MLSSDALFAKEFRNMMYARKANTQLFKTLELPMPKLESLGKYNAKNMYVTFRGIAEPFFKDLCDSHAVVVGRTVLSKRVTLANREFKKDAEGKIVMVRVSVPHDSIAVISDVNIHLKSKVQTKSGVMKDHVPTEGFAYVDCIKVTNGLRYIYIVPKRYVYRTQLYALILAPKAIPVAFYKGVSVALQNGDYAYLYVIKYNYRKDPSYRLLGTKTVSNFDSEIRAVLATWSKLGLMFDLKLTSLEDNVKGVTNLAFRQMVGKLAYESTVVEYKSLAEEHESDVDSRAETL